MLPFFFPLCLLFQRLPVARFAQRRPLLVGSGPLGIALVVMVEAAVLYHASDATSVYPLVLVRFALRLYSVSRRKKMVVASARVIWPFGCTVPSG